MDHSPPPIRLGMVGGGPGALIGPVHRIAARMDGQFALVAGALSSDPDRGRAAARALGLAEDRIYPDAQNMARAEARRPDGIEAVAIVTPNHLHAAAARAFLRRDIHVICDKPLTATLAEARRLARSADRSRALLAVTYTYSGYPMVRQARAMVAAGALGALRLVQVEYAQGWLAPAPGDHPPEADPRAPGHRQALWRTDPARSGPGGAIADIGTHAFHLAGFVSGLKVDALAADLHAFAPGRRLDDTAHVLLRFDGGARGGLWCSQVATGAENGLRLRLFGTEGALEWSQETPEVLWHSPAGAPRRRLTRGGPGTETAALSRVPAGHPEGYLEAFATLYADAAAAIRAHAAGRPVPGDTLPGIAEGLAGMAFVDACLRSSARNAAWVRL